jgi:isocitrate/isopropylmalate dehydrogenase
MLLQKNSITKSFDPALVLAPLTLLEFLIHETHEICMKADAVLFGAIGHPKYDNDPTAKVRPEQGLLLMRKKIYLLMYVLLYVLFNR